LLVGIDGGRGGSEYLINFFRQIVYE
jgi:hypothetical protein